MAETLLSQARDVKGQSLQILAQVHLLSPTTILTSAKPGSVETIDYALFRPADKVFDEMTAALTFKTYRGIAVFFSYQVKLTHFGDLEVVMADTGWPCNGD